MLEEWWLRSPGAAERVDVHVVVWDAKSLQGQGQMGGLAQYPVNLLRNVAMLAARTEVVLLLDVNFVNFDLFSEMHVCLSGHV